MAATNNEVWQTATVIEVRDVAEGIRRITLDPALPLRAEPGSHIDLMVLIGADLQRRSYSVVESNERGTRLVISVLRAPRSRGGSLFMHTLVPGQQIEITQPLQNFPLRIGAPRYVLLAGGIGITAMMNMAMVLQRLKVDYTLVYVGRSRSAMAYLDQLQAVHGPRLEVHVDAEGSPLDVQALLSAVTPDTELYMCGPIRLMDAVRRGWREHGLDLPNLRFETFGNSGWFDPEEFIVRIPRLGVETRVGQAESMLEALERSGVEMMSDCRKGECGLCEVRVLDAKGAIDHRDVFYSERQQNARAKMCCCVSRAVTSATGARADADPAAGPAVVSIDVS